MSKEVNRMKYLKIEDNKGLFQIGDNNWQTVDCIDKDDLMTLLDKAIDTDFEMDNFVAESLQNKAHQIIYRNLHEKFSELLENKSRFKDESEQLYKNELEKYSKSEPNGEEE